MNDPITLAILYVCSLEPSLISEAKKYEVIRAADTFKEYERKASIDNPLPEEIRRFKAWGIASSGKVGITKFRRLLIYGIIGVAINLPVIKNPKDCGSMTTQLEAAEQTKREL